MEGPLSPRLRSGTKSFLLHFLQQASHIAKPRFKGWGNRHHILIGGPPKSLDERYGKRESKGFGPFFRSVYHIDHNIQVNNQVGVILEGRAMLEKEKVKGARNR